MAEIFQIGINRLVGAGVINNGDFAGLEVASPNGDPVRLVIPHALVFPLVEVLEELSGQIHKARTKAGKTKQPQKIQARRIQTISGEIDKQLGLAMLHLGLGPGQQSTVSANRDQIDSMIELLQKLRDQTPAAQKPS